MEMKRDVEEYLGSQVDLLYGQSRVRYVIDEGTEKNATRKELNRKEMRNYRMKMDKKFQDEFDIRRCIVRKQIGTKDLEKIRNI